MNKPSMRCAIYARKSTDEGLDQEFNSLDAQREACAAFVLSQKAEGWIELPGLYNDGGYSGGSLERPALKQLLKDIEADAVDVVVVYKIDRLSRSLMDFARLVEVFDRKGVTFVSVTQSFNTTTSMGRLTLNVLLSFAQFEREVISERVRDKFSASKKKGMWMGGNPPLGYDISNRKLVVNTAEAATIRFIYQRYLDVGCVRLLAADLRQRGIVSKLRNFSDKKTRGGTPLNPSSLYCILTNRAYIGETVHKGAHYPGQHEAIVSRELFDCVRLQLTNLAPKIKVSKRSAQAPLLGGLIFDETGVQMVPSYTVKRGSIRYRYYVSRSAMKGVRAKASIYRLPATPFEALVTNVLKRLSLPRGERLHEYIRRITVLPNSIEVKLDRQAAFSAWREDNRQPAERQFFQAMQRSLDIGEQLSLEDHTIVLILPVRAHFRGASRNTVDYAGPPAAKPDKVLLKAIARAHQWRKILLKGEVNSIDALAKRFGMDRGHVRLTLGLAFINPLLIRSIVHGEKPELRIGHLIAETFPLSWQEQRKRYSDCTTSIARSV